MPEILMSELFPDTHRTDLHKTQACMSTETHGTDRQR